MADPFLCTAQSALDVIALIERDLPDCKWYAGKPSRCDSAYAANIVWEGPLIPGVRILEFDLETGASREMAARGDGWTVHCHGDTLVEALGLAYTTAMEQNDATPN